MVELISFFEDDNNVYLVLEHCEGDLSHYLKQHGKLSETNAKKFLYQIVDGLR